MSSVIHVPRCPGRRMVAHCLMTSANAVSNRTSNSCLLMVLCRLLLTCNSDGRSTMRGWGENHRRGLGLYFLPMYSPPSSIRRPLPTLMVLVLLLLTTNAYACLVPLYGWGSGAMQACGTPQPPVRDFCEPFRSLGFHAAPPKP